MRLISPRCKPIPEEALEMLSDVLLASSPKDSDHPTFNEEHLARRGRRISSAEVYLGMAAAENRIFEGSEEETSSSSLTPRQRLVWEMYVDGYSPSEIADALGITRPTAMRILRNAGGIAAVARTRLRGLKEVYRSEVRRKGYRKPEHCSEERCRKMGYCKYGHVR